MLDNDSKHEDVAKLDDYWSLMRDCYAGEKAVHSRGERYLPRLDKQSETQYESYLKRARFLNGVRRTVDGLSGLVFRKDPTVKHDSMDNFMVDVSLQRQSLSSYTQRVVSEALVTGAGGTLVDYPESEEGLTVAEAESLNMRPIFKYYVAENVKNWRYKTVNNVSTLVEVVLTEKFQGEDGSSLNATRHLLIENGQYFQILTKETANGGEEIELYEPEMDGKRLDFIPFVFHDTKSGGGYELPTLTDLADTNMHHYQLEADHSHGLRYVALPTPYITGVDPTDSEVESDNPESKDSYGLTLGSSEIWLIGNENAKVGMLEFTGSGLAAIREQLNKIEAQMAQMGAKVLMPESTSGFETATAAIIGAKGETSLLSRVTDNISNQMTILMKWAAMWMSKNPEKVEFILNNDFLPTGMEAAELTALVNSWLQGAISNETLFDNLKRGEIVGGDVEFDDEQERINSTPPPRNPNNTDDSDDDIDNDNDDDDDDDDDDEELPA